MDDFQGLPLAVSSWGDEELKAIESVIKSGRFSMGKEVERFEETFADYFGSRYAVMVNSGSSANLLAISALCYKSEKPLMPGDEVIVPSLSWPTTYYPITQNQLKLVFVDIDRDTLNIDIAEVEKAISSKTKAIFVPNILGNPADLKALTVLCQKHNLYLIEDNCESMGAKLDNKYCGTYGIMGTFSCFFSHHISTMEGGVIITDDEELYHILLAIRSHGWTRSLPSHSKLHTKTENEFYETFNFVLPGYNVRPIEMSGAIGVEQMKKLTSIVEMRRKNAKHFVSLFKGKADITIQKENGCSSWFGFSFLIGWGESSDRDQIVKMLSSVNIEARPVISGNFLRHKVMKFLDSRIVGDHSNSNFVHDHGFFIGNHAYDIRKELDGLEKRLCSEW